MFEYKVDGNGDFEGTPYELVDYFKHLAESQRERGSKSNKEYVQDECEGMAIAFERAAEHLEHCLKYNKIEE